MSPGTVLPPSSTAAPPARGGAARGARHARWALLVIVPGLFTLAALLYPMRQFHWDVLERAYLLEHPRQYMRSWDGTPRSQFLSFAHVLELPLASLARPLVAGRAGLPALWVFEALVAGGTLFLLGSLVRFARRAGGAAEGAERAAILAQLGLATSLSFWKLGAGGQEKMLAPGTQLLFLACYWRALAGPTVAPPRSSSAARRRDHIAWSVAGALAFAILSHLTSSVLVPFAIGALWILPPAWRPQRARVARGVVLGALGAGLLYVAIAVWTTGVTTPARFFSYLTYFHHGTGHNFFELAGGRASEGSRVLRGTTGLASFFAGGRIARPIVLGVLLASLLVPLFRRRARTAAGGLEPEAALRRQVLLLAGLWTLHFAFFEPHNFESWTLVAALLVLWIALLLPDGRRTWAAALPLALLLGSNYPHYVANHRIFNDEPYRGLIDRASRSGDIVLLTGGMMKDAPVDGSDSMRYFLATERRRTIVSLYDLMGLTQLEYWGRPFASPEALQAALDAGRRVYAPVYLLDKLRRGNTSGLLRTTWAARGDSVLEITHIETGPRR